MRKFIFLLKFEAKLEIEADTVEEAEARARVMMDDVRVVRTSKQMVMDRQGGSIGFIPCQEDAEDYVRMDPCYLGEAKE